MKPIGNYYEQLTYKNEDNSEPEEEVSEIEDYNKVSLDQVSKRKKTLKKEM